MFVRSKITYSRSIKLLSTYGRLYTTYISDQAVGDTLVVAMKDH